MKKPYDLRERTFKFAKRVLSITEYLPRKSQCEVIRRQLARSGTSIGANVEEADGTITKKDFVSKMVIARKEAKETHLLINHDKHIFWILRLGFVL